MRVRQWAHLPRHRSKTRSVTEADPTLGSRGGEGKGCANTRNFRAFTPVGRSVTEASPLSSNLLFSGVETPLKQTPSEAFFHLVKGLGGGLSEKAGLNSRGKKLGEGRAEQRR